MTFGENLVGLSHNPSGNPDARELKTLAARMIDILFNLDENSDTQDGLKDTAIGHIITAQMWAVKAATFDSPPVNSDQQELQLNVTRM
jgi:hypothetical protein